MQAYAFLEATRELTRHQELLEFIKNARGFDFTGYKRSSLMPRFQKRMRQISIDSLSEYMDYLQGARTNTPNCSTRS